MSNHKTVKWTLHKILKIAQNINMKKLLSIFLSLTLFAVGLGMICSPLSGEKVWAENSSPKMAIIIDDFGGYDQSGVETMLKVDAPLTCAVMPNLENSEKNSQQILDSGKEVILHMPMQAHVSLPLSWYGPNYICTGDSKETVNQKISKALETVKGAKGFNIHIGSGVCQDTQTMRHIYDYASEHNLFFVDSRTHINTQCAKVANEKHILYLGRDEFLEPGGNKSYEGVFRHIMAGAEMAKTKGHAIIIGHVGSHGGENTAKAISDAVKNVKDMGIEIVPMSELANSLKQANGQKQV